MDYRSGHRLFLSLLTIGTLLGSGGCSKSASAPQSQPHPVAEDGTSHGGGGTGIDLKVFEAYIKDPTTLPAYQKYVLPRIRRVFGNDDASFKTAEALLKSKTWIIAPIELNPVSKESLGVIFTESGLQQLGLQYLNEIWINSNLFYDPKSTIESQGQLILHEFVMLLYFLRFESYSEICRRYYRGMSMTASADSCLTSMDPYIPKEKLRPLNEDDNQKIRRVTGLLQQSGVSASHEQLLNIFRSNGFGDLYFFNEALQPKTEREKTYPLRGLQLRQLIREAIQSQALLPDCILLTSSKITPCELNLEKSTAEPIKGFKIELDSFQFKTEFGAGRTDSYIIEESMHYLVRNIDPLSKQEFLMTVIAPFSFDGSPNSKIMNLQVFLIRDPRQPSRFQITALNFIPFAIVKDSSCRATRIRARSTGEEAVNFAVSESFRTIAKLYAIADYDCD